MAEERKLVRKVKNGALFSDGSIRIENARASYPFVTRPQVSKNDDGTETTAYQLQLLMPKSTHREVKDLCKERIAEVLKENKVPKIADDRKFIKDGDAMAKDECEGQWIVSSREKNPPALRSNKKDPATGKAKRINPEKEPNKFYGGCYVTALIKPWLQNNKYGKRVNANLLAVQFIKDGEPFGESRIRDEDVDDSFEAEDEDDEGGFDEDDDDDL